MKSRIQSVLPKCRSATGPRSQRFATPGVVINSQHLLTRTRCGRRPSALRSRRKQFGQHALHFTNLWLVVLLGFSVSAADKTGILLVTGVDYPGHKWRETAPALKRILEADPRLDVRIVEDPHFLDSAALTNYAAVLLHFQNWETPGPGVTARENLRRYVQQGGGLMSVHFACGAWHGEWPEFQNLVGRVWHGAGPGKPQHDARGPFTVRIVDKAHPITRGLGDFETDDELYTCLTGGAPIHVVADAKSRVDKKDHPMGFVREYGQGRVFLTTLGHDVKAFTNSCVPQLLRQGCAWTAKLPPSASPIQ